MLTEGAHQGELAAFSHHDSVTSNRMTHGHPDGTRAAYARCITGTSISTFPEFVRISVQDLERVVSTLARIDHPKANSDK
jgi:hypothetical protein